MSCSLERRYPARVAMAIQNVRLYQSEHNQREMAEALTQAANALNSHIKPGRVLDTLLEQTLRVVSCKSLNVMLIEGDKIFVVRRKGYEHFPEHIRHVGEYRFPLSTPTFHTMSPRPAHSNADYKTERVVGSGRRYRLDSDPMRPPP